ncbi:MAG: bifunctional riboflavin kinase/FAD synthetase [Bacteroidetes bacterium]|nr:bifunctional riboflavin kinase/FAD synthetase [Bacteroidota bacterium]MBP6314132.1 bifunctional riboflavin kinase/FAD synthetase [Chitinophagaceae bacterium]
MNVFFGLDRLPRFRNAVVTIGTFDGVHVGHKVILKRLKEKAREVDGETVIITFEPHPRLVLTNQKAPISLLNTLQEKIDNLQQEGVDNVVVVNFTLDFADQSAASYVEHFLFGHFQPHTLIIGYDHLFGKGRQGNFQLLETLKSTFHYELEEIPMQVVEQNKISSTQIRNSLKEGDVAKAARYLGKPYSIEGVVIEGANRGKQLGYPTANLVVQDAHKLIPKLGVYAVKVQIMDQLYGGMMNVGYNPTFSDTEGLHLEVHLFHFDQNLYGSALTVLFIDRLRDEMKFEGVDQLILALEQDKRNALEILDLK